MEGRVSSRDSTAAGAVSQGGTDIRPAVAASSDALSPAAARLRPWLTWPAWLVCLCLTIFAPVFPALALRYEFYPFALGLIVLGLPHGAMDHLVQPHLLRRPPTFRYLTAFVGLYLLTVLLYLALWRLAPLAALGVFLAISWLHWGQGDYDYLRLFEQRSHPHNAFDVGLIWLVRGGLPIFLPVLAFPATFARVGAGLTRWYGGASLPAPGHLFVSVGLAILLSLIVVVLWQSWRDHAPKQRVGFWRDAGELVLLWVFFWRVPPVMAVGVYFCLWHSARHIGRLMLADPVTSALLTQGRLPRAAGRTALQSLPMTLGAILLLVGLYFAQQHQADATLPSLVYLYLSLIAALTIPHFLIVLWMDRRQRL
jgi:Brp/Blh family beta-carotene 15,15'-monooxygenase